MRPLAAPLSVAALVMACGPAFAQTQAQAPQGAAATAADQIGAAPRRADLGAAQITAARPRIDAPPPLAAGQRRDTRVAPVVGHDRCDPAVAGAERQADCTAIAERRADDFAGPPQDRSAVAVAVDPAKPPADLVDGIVNGGTGSVVQLPK